MSTEANKAAARRLIDEVLNGANPAVLDELVAPEVVHHSLPPGMPQGIESYRALTAGYRVAFPDVQATIEELVAEGDRVVVRMTSRGTQQGEFLGIPPTGKRIEASSLALLRFANGKLAEEWAQADLLGVLQQLGAFPMPEQVPARP
jgi:steroid delta-isomerase-like uncharacterized protein